MLPNSKKKALIEDFLTKLNDEDSNITELGEGSTAVVYKVGTTIIKKLSGVFSQDYNHEVDMWLQLSEIKSLAPFMPVFLGGYEKNAEGYNKPSINLFKTDKDQYLEQLKRYLDRPEKSYYILQKYEPTINLENFLKKRVDFTQGYALFNNLIRAFEILHDSGYIHRDIKPANILIRTEKNMDSPLIIDVGLACKLPCDEENKCGPNNSFQGTPLYTAPNLLQKNELPYKPNFPVTRRNGLINKVKGLFGCSRKRKRFNRISVKTKNAKIKSFYNIATDDYALALTLEELVNNIDWSGQQKEKEACMTIITKLKSKILPFLAAGSDGYL